MLDGLIAIGVVGSVLLFMYLHDTIKHLKRRIDRLERSELLYHAYCSECREKIEISPDGRLACECSSMEYGEMDVPLEWDIRSETVWAALKERGYPLRQYLSGDSEPQL